MSLHSSYHPFPVQGSNPCVQSLLLGGNPPSSDYPSASFQTPLSNFFEADLDTALFVSPANISFGATGTMSFTALSNKVFVNIPSAGYSGGGTGTSLKTSELIPEQFRPAHFTAYGSCIIVVNGLAPDVGIFSVTVDGSLSFTTRPGASGIFGNSSILPQTLEYNLN